MFEVIIPAKFLPAALITPPFPTPNDVWPVTTAFVNWKLPEIIFVSFSPLSRTTSAEKVETPTALSNEATSLNPKVSTLVINLPSAIPLIEIDSFFKNLPLTSTNLKSVAYLTAETTYPVAPLLEPWILSVADKDVIAVPTLISVNVLTSNKRISYWVLAFTKLPDWALKSYSLASPISDPLFPFLLDIKETVAVVPIPKLGDPEILLRKRGLPVEYVTASSSTSLVDLGFGTSRKVGAIFSNLYPFTYAIPGDILITIKSLVGVLPCAVNCSDV